MLAPLNYIIRSSSEIGKTVEAGRAGHIQHSRRRQRLAQPRIEVAKVRAVVGITKNASATKETEALL